MLGNPDEIRRVAEQQGVVLSDVVEIIDPVEARERYVPRLVELRKSKGITEVVAREQLEDNVVLGTLMLERNEVDGLVSVPCTLQRILFVLRCRSSKQRQAVHWFLVFFMLLPDQVLVYGDSRSIQIQTLNNWQRLQSNQQTLLLHLVLNLA